MSIAVVIPLFNGEAWIRETLRSVREQTLVPGHVVVVDDHSSDRSPDIVKEFEGVELLCNPTKGSAAARNFGASRTNAGCLAFLDHDDLWHRDHLRLLSGVLDEHPDAPVAFSRCRAFSDGEPRLAVRPDRRRLVDAWEFFPVYCPVPGPSAALVRREPFDAVGGFDNDFVGIADYHLWLRISAGRPFVGVDARSVGLRVHPASQSAGLRGPGYEFLELHRRVARAVSGSAPDERPTRRCRSFDAAAEMARAVAESDRAGAVRAARELEEAVADEPREYIEKLFANLADVICRRGDGRRGRFELMASFDAIWPADAKRTRAVLASWREVGRDLVCGRVHGAAAGLRLLRRRRKATAL